jgi:hypothetical protein
MRLIDYPSDSYIGPDLPNVTAEDGVMSSLEYVAFGLSCFHSRLTFGDRIKTFAETPSTLLSPAENSKNHVAFISNSVTQSLFSNE